MPTRDNDPAGDRACEGVPGNFLRCCPKFGKADGVRYDPVTKRWQCDAHWFATDPGRHLRGNDRGRPR